MLLNSCAVVGMMWNVSVVEAERRREREGSREQTTDIKYFNKIRLVLWLGQVTFLQHNVQTEVEKTSI